MSAGEPWQDDHGRVHPGAELRHGEYGAEHHRPYVRGDDRPLDGGEALALIRAREQAELAEALELLGRAIDLGGEL